MQIETKYFDELNTAELYQLLQLRSAVFVVEQNCVYQDMDGKDKIAIHVLGKLSGNVEAYLRIFKPGDYFETPSIGRVVVSEAFRRKGFANKIMKKAMDHILNHFNEKKVTLSAQCYLTKFYNELGFVEEGDSYLEDGIPHVKMVYG